ncbi:MAG TPA: DUF3108 domain-containing protein, partial [Flavobacteriales bacterium]|nr:DUF3108 domain-containing protein [Flavobacteriales bacterium]
MARTTTILLASVGLLGMSFSQSNKPAEPAPKPAASEVFPLRDLPHTAFRPGEKLTYVVHYGWVNAGEATVELKE